MTILVFSDSHGNYRPMERALRRERPDAVFHLGDGGSELEKLAAAWPRLPLTCVKGNCDTGSSLPEHAAVDLEGFRFFLTHGHNYSVRFSLDRLLLAAQLAGADAALFGHTHVQVCETRQGMRVLNPGSIGKLGQYAVIEIKDGRMICRTEEISDN